MLNARARTASTSLPAYQPLIVFPELSKHKAGRLVAFIGRQLCFFEERGPQPVAGEPIEVMITRPLYRRDERGYIDYDRLIALVIRPVTADDMLIEHRGFECAGSSCSTLASTTIDGVFVLLKPSGTGAAFVDNVNWKFDGLPAPLNPVPAYAWVKRPARRLMRGMEPMRIEGLARIEDGAYAAIVRR